jgi:hypothetical protein
MNLDRKLTISSYGFQALRFKRELNKIDIDEIFPQIEAGTRRLATQSRVGTAKPSTARAGVETAFIILGLWPI